MKKLTMTEELENKIANFFEENNITLARAYWEILVRDYLDCLEEQIDLTDEETKEVVESLLNDDRMWREIDDSVEWYVYHLPRLVAKAREGN